MLKNSFQDKNSGVSFQYPPAWEIESDGNIISLYNPDGVGSIQVSIYHHAENSFDARGYLESILKKQNLDAVIMEKEDRIFTSFTTSDGKYWLIQNKGLLVFVTYNCDVSDAQTEATEVRELIGSIDF